MGDLPPPLSVVWGGGPLISQPCPFPCLCPQVVISEAVCVAPEGNDGIYPRTQLNKKSILRPNCNTQVNGKESDL